VAGGHRRGDADLGADARTDALLGEADAEGRRVRRLDFAGRQDMDGAGPDDDCDGAERAGGNMRDEPQERCADTGKPKQRDGDTGGAALTERFGTEKQLTQGPGGRILTNCSVWSPDGQWLVYDTRSDAEGAVFDGTRVEIIHADTGQIKTMYESRRGACCGVATFHPLKDEIVFILGPEDPTPDWAYSPSHRQGVIVLVDSPGEAVNLDARDLTPPGTPGALRGGSHVHVFSPDGKWVSFTYNDALADSTQRTVGVAVPGPVTVNKTHSRNRDGTYFSTLVTRTVRSPRPGSDDIGQALEDGWIGTAGYVRGDGTRQARALAFQGQVMGADGRRFWEVFVCDLPEDILHSGPNQRRVTFTENSQYPGISGPRHWLRSSPDGAEIAFLGRDAAGQAQIWTVSPNGGPIRQVTHDPWPVASAFTWDPAGERIAYVADDSVFTVGVRDGLSERQTPRVDAADTPLPLACVFCPEGRRIAFLRRPADRLEARSNQSRSNQSRSNQICVVTL